jgi:hypothetical protein
MPRKMSQKDMVLDHLKSGQPITQWDAIQMFRATRLGAIIYDLKKDGWDISTEMVYDKRTGKNYAKYQLVAKASIWA